MAIGKRQTDKPNVMTKQGARVTRANGIMRVKSPPDPEEGELIMPSIETHGLSILRGCKFRFNIPHGEITAPPLNSLGSLPIHSGLCCNGLVLDPVLNVLENDNHLRKVGNLVSKANDYQIGHVTPEVGTEVENKAKSEVKTEDDSDIEPLTRRAVTTKRLGWRALPHRFSTESLKARRTTKPIHGFAPTKSVYSFRIGNHGAVGAFMTEVLLLLQQQCCKKIAKEYIKALCPKKQSKTPYRMKVKGANAKAQIGAIPEWWPLHSCQYKEPDHVTKGERTALVSHVMRLNVTPVQWQEWNINKSGEKLEPNKTHLTRGWVAYLEEVTPSSLLEERNDEPPYKVKRRANLFAALFAVARMEEEFSNGERDGSDIFSWDLEAGMDDVSTALKARKQGQTNKSITNTVSDASSSSSALSSPESSLSFSSTSGPSYTPPTDESTPSDKLCSPSTDSSGKLKKRKRCTQEDTDNQTALIVRRSTAEAAPAASSMMSRAYREIKPSQYPPKDLYMNPPAPQYIDPLVAGGQMALSLGSIPVNPYSSFAHPSSPPLSKWTPPYPPPQSAAVHAYRMMDCPQLPVGDIPQDFSVLRNFPYVSAGSMLAGLPNHGLVDNSGGVGSAERYTQPILYHSHNVQAPPPGYRHHQQMEMVPVTGPPAGFLEHSPEVAGLSVPYANDYLQPNAPMAPSPHLELNSIMPADLHNLDAKGMGYYEGTCQPYEPNVRFRYPNHKPPMFNPPDSLNGPEDRGFTGYGSGVGGGALT